MMFPSPISLYVHIPWCRKKCPYCDFASLKAPDVIPEEAFLTALKKDLEESLRIFPHVTFISVFFGGGTPNVLSPSFYSAFLDFLSKKAWIDGNTEITLEANPGIAPLQNFRAYQSAGINRFSLGVQTFSDRLLKRIGRIHDAHQAQIALEEVLHINDKVSIDLMYGLPTQSLSDLQTDLAILRATDTPHVSLYQLTLEPDTPFGRKPPKLPDEKLIEDMEESIHEELKLNSLYQYETSAYAKEGHRCRHNLNYWLFGDYIGIGPGAHGKYTTEKGVFREIRGTSIQGYLESSNLIEEKKPLNKTDRLFEALINAGRLTEGFDLEKIAQHSQLPLSCFESSINYAIDHGYWIRSNHHIQPTALGQRFLNQLLSELPLSTDFSMTQ